MRGNGLAGEQISTLEKPITGKEIRVCQVLLAVKVQAAERAAVQAAGPVAAGAGAVAGAAVSGRALEVSASARPVATRFLTSRESPALR